VGDYRACAEVCLELLENVKHLGRGLGPLGTKKSSARCGVCIIAMQIYLVDYIEDSACDEDRDATSYRMRIRAVYGDLLGQAVLCVLLTAFFFRPFCLLCKLRNTCFSPFVQFSCSQSSTTSERT
jgi:hypothetical protein